MAKTLIVQMANSNGLSRIVEFTGLSHTVLLHPIVHGEPLLTAQGFYYLDDLEAVAKIRFETKTEEIDDADVEYLIDNYLFEFSKKYPAQSINIKIDFGKFWNDSASDFYIEKDHRHTQSLAIDSLNDTDVLSIRSENDGDGHDFSDWDIGGAYVHDCIQSYLNALTSTLDKKALVNIAPSVERMGYRGKLRVFKTGDTLIDYWQGQALTNISVREIDLSMKSLPLPQSQCAQTVKRLNIERISGTKRYNPALLSHYFSGLKEDNPLKAFVGYYNVLEHYFEDAPRRLGRTAPNEQKQLECVVSLITSAEKIGRLIESIEPQIRETILANLPTSSGISIDALNVRSDLETELARWLYQIRCAIIHSKKTRRGLPTATFAPYSSASQVIRPVIPIIQWLAVACIEKDHLIENEESRAI